MTDVISDRRDPRTYVDIDPKSLKFSFYKSHPDKTVKLKNGLIYVMTKKNKGTVIGVYTAETKAVKTREMLGGERYYRISRFFVDDDIYK